MQSISSDFFGLVRDCYEVVEFMQTLWASFPEAYRLVVLAFLAGAVTIGMIKLILF